MSTKKDRYAGFGLILIILFAFMVVGVLGVTGWQVYEHYLSANPTKSNTSPHQSSQDGQKPPVATTTHYCSTQGGLCFDYPKAWTLAEASVGTSNALVTVTNPSETIEISYKPEVSGVGGSCRPDVCFFTTLSLKSIGRGLTVVKGVFSNTAVGNIVPYYFVGSDSILDPYGLQIGKRVDVGFFAALLKSPVDSSMFEELRVAKIPESSFSSKATATSWLNGADVATAGTILDSVTTK